MEPADHGAGHRPVGHEAVGRAWRAFGLRYLAMVTFGMILLWL